MYVVCHQNIGMDIALMFYCRFGQFLQLEMIVTISAENSLAIVASLNDMLGLTREHKTR